MPMPGGARPDEHDPGVGHGPPGRAHARQHAGHDDRGGALDVVVERRDAVLVAVQDAQGVVLLEVLELDEAARPDRLDAGHEGLDELVIGGAAQARRPIAEVQRIGQQPRVVGAHVERDRQGQRRVDAAGRRVQGELADRDGHPARTLVAQAQDALVVGDDDEPHVLERALAQDLGDALDVGRGDPRPARAPDDVAELLARPADRRRVDDGQELLEVLAEQSIEERRVAVLERGQADVLLERVGLDPQVLELQLDLLVEGQDPVGQQPRSLNVSRSSTGKASSLVSSRVPSRAGPASPMRAGRPAAMSSNGAGNGRTRASIVFAWTPCPCPVSAGRTACAPPRCSRSTSTPRR